MKKRALPIFVFFLSIGFLSCGGSNYLSEMSSKTSDEALYNEALKLVDQKKYDEALSYIARMSEEAQTYTPVVQTVAGIYAGKCGLDFLDFVSKIGDSEPPFKLFMKGFRGTSLAMEHCQTAQDIIEDYLGDSAVVRVTNLGEDVGGNVNTFMAILGMTKIGGQLRAVADQDGSGGNGDGSVDASFNACQTTSITDTQVAQVGTGFALILDNFATIAAVLSDDNSNLLEGMQTLCSSFPGGTNPCAIAKISDPAWSNPGVLLAIRGMIRSKDVGIQNCLNDGAGMGPHPFNCCP